MLVKAFEGLGCLQCCYGIACLVVLHVYRFQPSGKIAAGDYMSTAQAQTLRDNYFKQWDATGQMPESYQYLRGHFLLGLVIWVWVGGFFLCMMQCCFAIAHQKRFGTSTAKSVDV